MVLRNEGFAITNVDRLNSNIKFGWKRLVGILTFGWNVISYFVQFVRRGKKRKKNNVYAFAKIGLLISLFLLRKCLNTIR